MVTGFLSKLEATTEVARSEDETTLLQTHFLLTFNFSRHINKEDLPSVYMTKHNLIVQF